MKNLKNKGFTLVELVITIVVIVILSAIAVPMYKDYGLKTKLSEGYMFLATVRDAQKAYYSKYGNFLCYSQSSAGNALWTSNEEVLGVDARRNKYFTTFHVGERTPKYYFEVAIKKPKELHSRNNTELILQYNITLGQRIIGWPKTALAAWY